MAFRFASAAFAAVVLSAAGALALTVEEVGGPAETPPASFTGAQFVDSRGCVFMRAGLDGRTAWVPRIDSNRRVICDRPPTFAPLPAPPPVAAAPEVATPEVAASPEGAAPQAAAAVAVPATASAPRTAAREAAPRQAAAARTSGRQIGCFADVPVPTRVRLADGGTTVLCTRGDGALDGARVPVYPPGEAPENLVAAQGAAVTVRRTGGAAAPGAVGNPPPGYRAAWQDGRLNPDRGPRTAEGDAQQDRLWTREVPARPVPPATAGRGASLADPAAERHYVQVGAFRIPDNAHRARDRLRAMGLPTARAETQGLTMVLAGPFASVDEARLARGAAQGAGFADAFMR